MASGPVHALGVSGSRYWSRFLSFPSAHINFFSVFSFSNKYFAQASAFKGLLTRKLEHQKQTILSVKLGQQFQLHCTRKGCSLISSEELAIC